MVKRILAARHYQRRDAPVRLLAQYGKAGIKRDIKSALKHLSALVPRSDQIIRMARAGQWSEVKNIIAWGHFREILKAPFARIGTLYESGAALGVQKINGTFAQARRGVRFKKDIGGRFNFDLYDQSTQAKLRAEQDRLIVELSEEARNTIDQIIISGATAGLSPEAIVDDIRAMIGLTEQQALAVVNYRTMLESLDPNSLRRQLRNTEFDGAVQDAIDSGVPLESAVIDQLTANYEENYLDYRAGMIAQTESVRAVNTGLQEAYEQAVERGAFPAEAVRQFWEVALDERTCEICLSIPEMNPDGVSLGEPFQSIDGPEDAPPVHPQCRCSLEFVTDLDMVPDATE